ncbi:hypothetical protein FQN60_005352 [Etheostoma spectabile]|uniref:Uncharacterized protein n=1 Tax=Etheostoma spectabile TaxID=54343 RepID=A0A5J5CE18_9PERO|nr:hypothetical protein FQN60_005352 [Etheostoma spectabile]
MKEAKRLTSTPELRRLVQSAESPPGSDLDDATKHLRNQRVSSRTLLAVGRQKSKIDRFYITMDKRLIPCKANRSLGAFDELSKHILCLICLTMWHCEFLHIPADTQC